MNNVTSSVIQHWPGVCVAGGVMTTGVVPDKWRRVTIVADLPIYGSTRIRSHCHPLS